jgi:hypothetical protein
MERLAGRSWFIESQTKSEKGVLLQKIAVGFVK